jgi:hypothetical protein
MPATVTNETKHTAVVTGDNKYGVALWDDPLVAWDAPLFTWDSKSISITNETKHSAIISNQSKS